jgi:hypothetical protein
MPVRRLLLVCLAACVPASPPPNTTADPPIKSVEPPPAQPARPAPPASPPAPRQLHPDVGSYGLLADGRLLIRVRGGDDQVLDPATGATTPWTYTWSPAAVGWPVDPDGTSAAAPLVSPDGRRVAISVAFEPRRDVADYVLAHAVLVLDADGGDPRCVGIGFTHEDDDPPQLAWVRETGRLVGAWTAECAADRGRPRSFPNGPKAARPTDQLRWYDPADAGHGLLAAIPHLHERDPQGDHAVVRSSDVKQSGLQWFDLRTGALLRTIPEPDDEVLWSVGWPAPDAILLNTHAGPGAARKLAGQRLEFADGRAVPVPKAMWRHWARLPGDEHLFTRDAGATLEQGRVDWATLTVQSSRPRPDLRPYLGPFDRSGGPTFTPGAGGILVHNPTTGGPLMLAAL